MAGAVVRIDPPGIETTTDSEGHYALDSLAHGPHTLTARVGTETYSLGSFDVNTPGQSVDRSLPVDLTFGERIVVEAPARTSEQLSNASASSSVIDRATIATHEGETTIPPLLAFTPGVEITRGNLFDFNVNARGFNSSLNRRMLVRVDGREPAIPLLGSPEWAALPLEDLESIEVVRGGASALYGANAFNGVIDARSTSLRGNDGGHVRITGGELNRRGASFTITSNVASDLFVRASGSFQKSDDFTLSRNRSVEYPGLAKERVPLDRSYDEVSHALLRADRYFGSSSFLTLEAGNAWIAGPTLVAGLGRVQQTDTQRPWARLQYASGNWSAQLTHEERRAQNMLALNSGARLFENSDVTRLELLRHLTTPRMSLTGGASAAIEHVDTLNGNVHTLLSQSVDDDLTAAFASAQYRVSSNLEIGAVGRWENSSLTGAHLSPRIAAIWNPVAAHTFRLSYNRSYQKPNYVELFLRAPLAPPKDLSAIEHQLAPLLNGISLGFNSVPVVATGNADLDVERLDSVEMAWTASLTDTLLTVSAYHNKMKNFITDPIPQLGTTIGRVNPNFGPYVPPVGVSAEAAAALAHVVPATLSNDEKGRPILVLYSYANYGDVTSDGVELAITRELGMHLRAEGSATFFTFDTKKEVANDPVTANAPRQKYAASLVWNAGRVSTSAGFRHSSSFKWAAGSFVGTVPSYDVADVATRVRLATSWSAALQVTNLFDDRHFEFFGGDLLRRNAFASLQYDW